MLATTTALVQFDSYSVSGPLYPGPQAPMPWSPDPTLPVLTASMLGTGRLIRVLSAQEIEAITEASVAPVFVTVWYTGS